MQKPNSIVSFVSLWPFSASSNFNKLYFACFFTVSSEWNLTSPQDETAFGTKWTLMAKWIGLWMFSYHCCSFVEVQVKFLIPWCLHIPTSDMLQNTYNSNAGNFHVIRVFKEKVKITNTWKMEIELRVLECVMFNVKMKCMWIAW